MHSLTTYRAMVTKLILNISKLRLATNSLPTPKDIPLPLDPKNYPGVWFWTAKTFKAHCNNLTGETDGLATQQRQHGQHRRDKDNENCYPYLENADGTLVPWDVIAKISQKARRVWHTLYDIGLMPPSWGKASETAYTYFNSEMLNVQELEFFRYCKGNWKVTWWAMKVYSSWAHNYLKSKEVTGTKPAQVDKWKHNLLDNPSLL